MPDQHFLVSLRDRLRLPVCPPQATCQHRRQDGTLCGAPLDSRGKHALKCEVGPTREARHDGLRDFTAAFHPKVSGYVAPKEQRVTAWDRVNPRTGLLEEARLDVATRDAASGRKIFVDTMVTCAHSGYEPRQQAHAGRDGVAAADAVRGKRRRYPPSGGELVPLIFEAGAAQLRRRWPSLALGAWRWTRPTVPRLSGTPGSSTVLCCSRVMLR